MNRLFILFLILIAVKSFAADTNVVVVTKNQVAYSSGQDIGNFYVNLTKSLSGSYPEIVQPENNGGDLVLGIDYLDYPAEDKFKGFKGYTGFLSGRSSADYDISYYEIGFIRGKCDSIVQLSNVEKQKFISSLPILKKAGIVKHDRFERTAGARELLTTGRCYIVAPSSEIQEGSTPAAKFPVWAFQINSIAKQDQSIVFGSTYRLQ
jgi:hypothetical protein